MRDRGGALAPPPQILAASGAEAQAKTEADARLHFRNVENVELGANLCRRTGAEGEDRAGLVAVTVAVATTAFAAGFGRSGHCDSEGSGDCEASELHGAKLLGESLMDLKSFLPFG